MSSCCWGSINALLEQERSLLRKTQSEITWSCCTLIGRERAGGHTLLEITVRLLLYCVFLLPSSRISCLSFFRFENNLLHKKSLNAFIHFTKGARARKIIYQAKDAENMWSDKYIHFNCNGITSPIIIQKRFRCRDAREPAGRERPKEKQKKRTPRVFVSSQNLFSLDAQQKVQRKVRHEKKIKISPYKLWEPMALWGLLRLI